MTSSIKQSMPETIGITVNKSQQDFVVISWNVLHMIHEINYVYDLSPVINRYSIYNDWSNEKRRLNDITKTLSELLTKHSTMECFICLQEVPGDLLPMLHDMFDSHAKSTLAHKPVMHIQTYSRKPRIRGRHRSSVYDDSNESLVIIHYNPNIISAEKAIELENATKSVVCDDQVLWTPCPIDAGKGALTVTTTSGLTVVNAHVPYNNRAAFLLLENISWPENNDPFIFVGDINRGSKAFMHIVARIVGRKPFSNLLFPVTTYKPTRVGLRPDGTLYKVWLDHYLVSTSLKHLATSPSVVHDDIGDISDHFPILL